jgi:hypothetical protein
VCYSSRVLPELLHAVQEVKIAHDYHHTRTSVTLEQITTKLASEPIPSQSASTVSAGHSVAWRLPISSTHSNPTLNSTSQLCVNAAIPNQRCEVLCACQCHTRSRFSTQTGLPLLWGRCSSTTTPPPTSKSGLVTLLGAKDPARPARQSLLTIFLLG